MPPILRRFEIKDPGLAPGGLAPAGLPVTMGLIVPPYFGAAGLTAPGPTLALLRPPQKNLGFSDQGTILLEK